MKSSFELIDRKVGKYLKSIKKELIILSVFGITLLLKSFTDLSVSEVLIVGAGTLAIIYFMRGKIIKESLMKSKPNRGRITMISYWSLSIIVLALMFSINNYPMPMASDMLIVGTGGTFIAFALLIIYKAKHELSDNEIIFDIFRLAIAFVMGMGMLIVKFVL